MQSIAISYQDDYAIVQLQNGKVNAIDTTLASDLLTVFTDLATAEDVKGVLLTSQPHGFSAGLNIGHIVDLDTAGATHFWRVYLGALQAMIRFPKPLVCGMTGYAPAGATILALCADYRVMGRGEKHLMGMHEFKLSMQIPEMLCDIYAYYLGEQKAWQLVQLARLFNSDEALAHGLVHESVAVEEVIPCAEKHLKTLMAVYAPAFQKTKACLRKGLLAIANRELEPQIATILADGSDPVVRQTMQAFVAGIKGR